MVTPEALAYWYFRLNGFLTTANFVIHDEGGAGQRTDADILGVRFPFRAELLEDPMVDDALFTRIDDRPFIGSCWSSGSNIFSIVPNGVCRL